MATTSHQRTNVRDTELAGPGLARRLDDIGWGVFLLMTGALWLFASVVPSGMWLVGTGLLLVALNAVRYLKRLPLNPFTFVLGVVALAGGLAELANVKFPIFAVALVGIGIVILIGSVAKRGA